MQRATNTPQRIVLKLMTVPDQGEPYAAFVETVEEAVDWCNQDMARNKNELQDLDENGLTQHFTRSLKSMGFSAFHELNQGGHCDITVEGPHDTLWLGEAKIFGAYPELLGGYRQLMSRYSTGYPGQDKGGILIYFTDRSAAGVPAEWERYLLQTGEATTSRADPRSPLNFYSSASHAGTGQPIEVRHMAVVLFHKPTDQLAKPKRDIKGAPQGS